MHCSEADLRPVITPSSVSITRSIAPLSSAPLGIHRVLRPAITRSSVRKASVPTGSHTSTQPRAVRREAQIDDTAPRIVLPSTLSSSLQHIRSQSCPESCPDIEQRGTGAGPLRELKPRRAQENFCARPPVTTQATQAGWPGWPGWPGWHWVALGGWVAKH